MLSEQRLDRLEPGAKPMLDPGEPLLVAEFRPVREIVPDTRHSGYESAALINAAREPKPAPMGRPATAAALDASLRDIREWPAIEQFYITVDQGRYHHPPIDRAVFGSELVDLLEMQETVFAADGLQVQRDARAETRLRAEIRIKLRRHLSSGFWPRHNWRGSMPDERLLVFDYYVL